MRFLCFSYRDRVFNSTGLPHFKTAWPCFPVGYRILLLWFILMLSVSQIWQWDFLQAVLCVLLTCLPLFLEHFLTFWLNEIFQTYLIFPCSSPGRSHFSKKPQILPEEGSVWPFEKGLTSAPAGLPRPPLLLSCPLAFWRKMEGS